MKRSIEELEGKIWPEPDFPSYVVKTCHAARKKPLDCLTPEELRCLIGQRIGLCFVLPIAVDLLQTDPLPEAGLFPGDLLLALLRLHPDDWAQNPEAYAQLKETVRAHRAEIAQCAEIPAGNVSTLLNSPETAV